MVTVSFPAPREVAFDYLADPRNRPGWQSSLARVEEVVGDVGVGQTWIDVTRPGLRPRMETTELDRPRRWTERGSWRRIVVTLTLTFAETATGCDVTATIAAPRPLRLLARCAVRADLRRAASTFSP
ncbi:MULTISPECIES: SRPBCC family protein [unclassified Nocardioides]|uniref:SRPBCC family protein n=1 Tax=unclassified Nocardioides TaxID=2615069 RepID=UPI003609CCE0